MSHKDPEKRKAYKREWSRRYRRTRRGMQARQRERKRYNRSEKYMLWKAKNRAKRKGILCTITAQDIQIPEYCPVLGMKLEYETKNHDSSPSLDRIDSSQGYIPGNIAVISLRANRLKNDATAIELRQIAAWIESVSKPEPLL